MTTQDQRRALRGVLVFLVLMIFLFGLFAPLSGAFLDFAFPGIFFLFFLIVVVIIVVNAATRGHSGIQRPYTERTAFEPPPPPDTILVECDYCETSQPFGEKCKNCGAPLPKPGTY